jgi:hypothetical protein
MRSARAGLVARIALASTTALFLTSCGDDPVDSAKGAVSGPSGPPPAHVGQAVPAHLTASGNSYDLTLTVDQVTCGIGTITGDSGTLDAPDGYRYCEADIDVVNTGSGTTGKLSFTGTMNGEDGASYPSDADATDAAGAIITTLNGKFYGDAKTPPLAPGRNAETTVVWALPLGIGPTHFSLAGAGVTGGAGTPSVGPIAVGAGDVTWQIPKGQ